MKLPSLQKAEEILSEAERLNPGPWAAHSRYVAEAASAIAACHPGMEARAAYIFGLLHDIGRRVGVTGMRHVLDGYHFLQRLGYDDAARVSLTHSYPVKSAYYGATRWDGSQEEFQFVQTYLEQIEYDPYDRLIQLCDSLALPIGFCVMEKRLVDVVMRYGFNEYTLSNWKARYAILEEFEKAIGKSIYTALPGVIENSLGIHQIGAHGSGALEIEK